MQLESVNRDPHYEKRLSAPIVTPIREAEGGVSANSGGGIDVGEEERERKLQTTKTKRTESDKDSCCWLDGDVMRERQRRGE